MDVDQPRKGMNRRTSGLMRPDGVLSDEDKVSGYKGSALMFPCSPGHDLPGISDSLFEESRVGAAGRCSTVEPVQSRLGGNEKDDVPGLEIVVKKGGYGTHLGHDNNVEQGEKRASNEIGWVVDMW